MPDTVMKPATAKARKGSINAMIAVFLSYASAGDKSRLHSKSLKTCNGPVCVTSMPVRLSWLVLDVGDKIWGVEFREVPYEKTHAYSAAIDACCVIQPKPFRWRLDF